MDVNWHSVNVPPGELSTFKVQNLSQDTSYEFYVRAKNIIGDGPRSHIVQATTKRAIAGLVTPINTDNLDVAASTVPGAPGKFLANEGVPISLRVVVSINYYNNSVSLYSCYS